MGGRALFKAYFHITMASLIPLALMARMESLEMDSRILERVILAKVAIGIGVMNLLPLPALDGGRLVFLIIEGIRRKPVPPRYEGYVHAAGLMLLLMLMVYVTGQDVLRIFMRSN